MNSFQTFSQLHQLSSPLILGNVWDVNSAKIFAQNDYKAIGTSSHAIAKSQGYEDGENLPFDILLRVARRIVETVSVPVTVDLEAGFSRTVPGIVENIKRLHDAGVAGINLEDSLPGKGTQQPVGIFQKSLAEIRQQLDRENVSMFINTRTDAFLLKLPNALQETLARIDAYKDAGASGIFVPFISDKNDIKQVVAASRLPVNVMCIPGLPDFDVLESLGVKRISMGPFYFNKLNTLAGALAHRISNDKSFAAVFSESM